MAELGRAAFRTGPFTVTVDGSPYVFPHVPAAWWADSMADRMWVVRILQLMEGDSYEDLLTAVESRQVRPDGFPRIARAAISEAAGRPWWEAQRLCSAAVDGEGRLLGRVLASGIDPFHISLAVYCAAIWAAVTHGAGPEDMLKLESMLTVMPPEALAEEGPQGEDLAAVAQRLRALPGVRMG